MLIVFKLGVDPSTDFRGMGVFALHQLVHFVTNRPTQARAVLLVSNHPRRFFPFAVAGINISAFIVSLLVETRMHTFLCKTCLQGNSILDNNFSYSSGPSNSQYLVDKACNTLNELYCRIFIEFAELWELRDPPTVMQFNEIFTEIQNKIRIEFQPI